MTDGEYLFDAMSKIPRFANWLEKYNEFYSGSGNSDILWAANLSVPFVIITIILISFIKPQSNKNKKPLSYNYLLGLLGIALLVDIYLIAMRSIDFEHTKKNSESEIITLSELKIHSIDFNKLPKWASDDLFFNECLRFVDIYKRRKI